MTLEEFITTNKITASIKRIDSNPNMNDFAGSHYKVTLRHQGAQMTTYFSKGFGHKGAPPTTAEVLECLASDSASMSIDFEEWAADLGYDPDSRKAEKIFKTCEKQAGRLHSFLGDDLYDRLLFDLDND